MKKIKLFFILTLCAYSSIGQVKIFDADSVGAHYLASKTAFLISAGYLSPVVVYGNASAQTLTYAPYLLTNHSYSAVSNEIVANQLLNTNVLPILSHGSNSSIRQDYPLRERAIRVAAVDAGGLNNNTSWGNGLDFVEKTPECTPPCQSYAAPRVMGKFYVIKHKLDSITGEETSWWEVFDRARKTASNNFDYDPRTGWGIIDVNKAVAFTGAISKDNYFNQTIRGKQALDSLSQDLEVLINDNEEIKYTSLWQLQRQILADYGYRYATDTLNTDVHIKMNSDATQNFGIGYLPNFSGGFANYGEYGIVLSPDNYGEISMFDFKGSRVGRGSKVYTSDGNNGMISFTQSKPKEAAGVLVSRGGLRLYSANSSGTTGYWGVVIDTSKFQITRNYSGVPETYELLPASSVPSTTSGARTTLTNIGNGSTSTPSFLRSQHGVETGTTDGSGDLTVTFAAAMPDATYTALCQSEGNANSYTWEVHTKTTSSFKIRVRDSNTKVVITATSVTFGYESKDY